MRWGWGDSLVVDWGKCPPPVAGLAVWRGIGKREKVMVIKGHTPKGLGLE